MTHKVFRTSVWALAVTLVAALPVLAKAQSKPAAEAKSSGEKPQTVTVTGCLEKGDEAGEYTITSEDGKKYELQKSTKLSFSKHLGHRVVVVGMVAKEKAEEHEKSEAGGEYAVLKATSLKMLSETCK